MKFLILTILLMTSFAHSDEHLLLTCSEEEAGKSYIWISKCQNSYEINRNYCHVIAYHKYCQPTTREYINEYELKPLKPHYENVFIRHE